MIVDDIIALLVIVLVLGGAVFYIVKAKKRGVKCIGCPNGSTCGAKNCSGCSCGQ